MPVPQTITDLVERFHKNESEYRAAHYNETQVREELINPLFEALGWDMANQRGLAADRKDVILEDSLRIAGRCMVRVERGGNKSGGGDGGRDN